jgi:hypothetical protein
MGCRVQGAHGFAPNGCGKLSLLVIVWILNQCRGLRGDVPQDHWFAQPSV